jgi:hypothetical protein
MGTRADFYIGTDVNAQWLGSIAYDGYPDGNPALLGKSIKTKRQFVAAVKKIFKGVDHFTLPEYGWPWPWENSQTTDYAYAWDDKKKKVMVSRFGRPYITFHTYQRMNEEKSNLYYERGQTQVFPDMKAIQNVDYGRRSGVMVISA